MSQCQQGKTSGFVAPGAHAFLDTIFMRDRLESDLQAAAIAVMTPQTGKLNYDNGGIRALSGSQIGVCNGYVAKGMLMPFDTNTDWTIPDISQVAPADKTARHFPGMSANLKGTGAIQSMELTLNIQV